MSQRLENGFGLYSSRHISAGDGRSDTKSQFTHRRLAPQSHSQANFVLLKYNL